MQVTCTLAKLSFNIAQTVLDVLQALGIDGLRVLLQGGMGSQALQSNLQSLHDRSQAVCCRAPRPT